MCKTEWKMVTEHAATGRRAFQRTARFEHTGNNEGTMEDDIKVVDADGTVLLETTMEIDWEYFGSISVAFSEDGGSVVVTGSDGQSDHHELAPPARPG